MMFLILQTVASKSENREYDVSEFQTVASKIENNEYDVSDPPNCSK